MTLNRVSQKLSINRRGWTRSLPFIILHLITLIGVFWAPFRWEYILLCLGSYYLRMFGVTAGYHRYFSHRSYKLGRVAQFFMAVLASSSAQKGVLWWAAHHRHHHKYSDLPEDLHSPIQHGFWWSHLGWILSDQNLETDWAAISDFAKFPELVWLNRFYLVPPILYAVVIYLLTGWGGLEWGFFVSTVLLYHGTFTINSLSHVYGQQRYATGDTSTNNFWLALITLGEGWHNNHHCYMSSTNQGFFWWEIDGSFYALKILSWIGIVKGIRRPPLALLEAKRVRLPDPSLQRQIPIALGEPRSRNVGNL